MSGILNDYAKEGSWQAAAIERIRAELEPMAHQALSMAYDWDGKDATWKWVATADVDEIIDWALS